MDKLVLGLEPIETRGGFVTRSGYRHTIWLLSHGLVLFTGMVWWMAVVDRCRCRLREIRQQ